MTKAYKEIFLVEMGLHFNRQKQLRKSIEMEKQGEALCRQAKDMICVANALRNRGRAYLKLNNVDSAEIFLVQSYELKKEINDEVGLPYALNDLAEIAMLRGDIESSVDYMQQSSIIREKLNDSTGLAININNIGEIYLQQKQYAKAIEFFEKSLKLSRSLKYTGFTKTYAFTNRCSSTSLKRLCNGLSIFARKQCVE